MQFYVVDIFNSCGVSSWKVSGVVEDDAVVLFLWNRVVASLNAAENPGILLDGFQGGTLVGFELEESVDQGLGATAATKVAFELEVNIQDAFLGGLLVVFALVVFDGKGSAIGEHFVQQDAQRPMIHAVVVGRLDALRAHEFGCAASVMELRKVTVK